MTEVTEQVDARKVAEDERLRLETILRTLPVGVILADARGTDRDRERPRPSRSRAATPRWSAGIWADTGAPIAPEAWALRRALRRGETSTGELIDIERPDGGRTTILNNAAPIRDAFGRITGAVAAFQDVTETRRAQREAEDAVRHRDEVLAIVSHDLQHPAQRDHAWARACSAAWPRRTRSACGPRPRASRAPPTG